MWYCNWIYLSWTELKMFLLNWFTTHHHHYLLEFSIFGIFALSIGEFFESWCNVVLNRVQSLLIDDKFILLRVYTSFLDRIILKRVKSKTSFSKTFPLLIVVFLDLSGIISRIRCNCTEFQSADPETRHGDVKLAPRVTAKTSAKKNTSPGWKTTSRVATSTRIYI